MSLQAVERFVNSVHFEQGRVEEHLKTPEALAAFLESEHLLDASAAVRPSDLRRAVELREAIRKLMEANNGAPVDPAAVDALNRAAERARVTAAFDDHVSWRIKPAAEGVDRAFGRLLAAIFGSMSDGTWRRMKACGNPDCRWAFFDESKNQSGRWCEMATCGNRMKARAFRERARKARATQRKS